MYCFHFHCHNSLICITLWIWCTLNIMAVECCKCINFHVLKDIFWIVSVTMQRKLLWHTRRVTQSSWSTRLHSLHAKHHTIRPLTSRMTGGIITTRSCSSRSRILETASTSGVSQTMKGSVGLIWADHSVIKLVLNHQRCWRIHCTTILSCKRTIHPTDFRKSYGEYPVTVPQWSSSFLFSLGGLLTSLYNELILRVFTSALHHHSLVFRPAPRKSV